MPCGDGDSSTRGMFCDAPTWSGGALLSPGELDGLSLVATGKVRDIYACDDETLLIVSSDRISAFDVIMLNGVPGECRPAAAVTAAISACAA